MSTTWVEQPRTRALADRIARLEFELAQLTDRVCYLSREVAELGGHDSASAVSESPPQLEVTSDMYFG